MAFYRHLTDALVLVPFGISLKMYLNFRRSFFLHMASIDFGGEAASLDYFSEKHRARNFYHYTEPTHKRWLSLFKRYIGEILNDRTSRRIFSFLILNFSFAFVELSYGIWTNSLGLISDAFHMFFDCTGLLVGLGAALVTRWPADAYFSYGYGRAEIIGGFCNALFLGFVAFFVFAEAVERVFEPPTVHHERLLLVSIGGLLVNLVGMFIFGDISHGHEHGGGSSHSHGHSHGFSSKSDDHGHSHSHGHSHETPKNALFESLSDGVDPLYEHAVVFTAKTGYTSTNGGHHSSNDHGHSHESGDKQILRGVFLHVLADTLGSVGVIISTLLIEFFGWHIADPICSMIIAALIFVSVLPLLRSAGVILMQRTPDQLDGVVETALGRVCRLPGVNSVRLPHFWTLCSGQHVGSLQVLVDDPLVIGRDLATLQKQVRTIFRDTASVQQLTIETRLVDGVDGSGDAGDGGATQVGSGSGEHDKWNDASVDYNGWTETRSRHVPVPTSVVS